MSKNITPRMLFLVHIAAAGKRDVRRFKTEADAVAAAAGWRKSGAHARVEKRVVGLPPLPSATDSPSAAALRMVCGPDAQWGGWNTAETNDALDALDA